MKIYTIIYKIYTNISGPPPPCILYISCIYLFIFVYILYIFVYICISKPVYHTQPANQPTSQPTSQPANQRTSQPTSQQTSPAQPTSEPANQPASQPAQPSQQASQPNPTHPAIQVPTMRGSVPYCSKGQTNGGGPGHVIPASSFSSAGCVILVCCKH